MMIVKQQSHMQLPLGTHVLMQDITIPDGESTLFTHTHTYFRLLSSQEEVHFFDPACVFGNSSFKYSLQGQKERAFDVYVMLSSLHTQYQGMFEIPDAQLSMLVVYVCKFMYCIFNVPDPKCHVVKWPAPGSPYYPGNSSLFTTHTQLGPKQH